MESSKSKKLYKWHCSRYSVRSIHFEIEVVSQRGLWIATRIGISELRRHYYRDISLDTSSSGTKIQLDIEDASASQGEQFEERRELVKRLERPINETLSDKQRIAIQGTLAGLSVEVIAERLQSNRNAVYKLVHDARLRLRPGLESEGVTIEDIEMNVA